MYSLGRVAEDVELGAVRPDDDAVGVDFVQADDRVFQEIRQLHLALGDAALRVALRRSSSRSSR